MGYKIVTTVKEQLKGRKPEQMGKGFWNNLAVHVELSEDDMRDYSEYFNWRKLSDNQVMSESFIRENADKVHWDRISQRMKMSEEFIEEFKDKVTWDYIWSYQRKLSSRFIENHLYCCKQIDWDRIVMYQKLDEKFIFNHLDDLKYNYIIEYQKLKKELFDKLFDYYMIHYKNDERIERDFLYHKIQHFKNASVEQCLRYIELKSKDGWGGKGWATVLNNQEFSEEFLEEHYDEIKNDTCGLFYLFRDQNLSKEFLKKHEKDRNAKQ